MFDYLKRPQVETAVADFVTLAKPKLTYCVLHGYYIEDLITQVNERLADGWHVTGGVSVTKSDDEVNFNFFQAMVKYE